MTWHTPHTWRPGDVARNLTARVLNAELRDQLQYLYDTLTAGPSVPFEAWTALGPLLVNAWADFGAPETASGYCKDPNGIVYLRGTIVGGANGAIAFTLPAGYRPSARVRLAVAVAGDIVAGELRIEPTGETRPTISSASTWATGDYVALNCSFRGEL